MATPFRSVDNIPPVPTLAEDKEPVYDVGSLSFRNDRVSLSTRVVFYEWPRGVDEVKTPKFWHPRSGEWCMVLRKDVSGALYMCFELLSSHIDGTVRATLKASLEAYGEKPLVYPLEFVCFATPKKSKWKRLTDAEFDYQIALRLVGVVNMPYAVTEPHPIVALHRPRPSVTPNLATMAWACLRSDVSLWAGGEEFKAHKAVLSARSPVFAAMLRHDSPKARIRSIEVQEIEADVLNEVLRFVYTESTPLLEEMADRLLVAADNFDLPDLKQLCEVELAENLTVDNAAATAVIALGRSCDVLKRCVVSFVQRHLLPVMGSKGWADAVTNHSGIVAELSRLIANETC